MILTKKQFLLRKYGPKNKELPIWELQRNIEIVKRNVENNWVAFNQNYGRMLIKLKINNHNIEFDLKASPKSESV